MHCNLKEFERGKDKRRRAYQKIAGDPILYEAILH